MNDKLNELLFADDQVLIATSEEQLQEHMNRLHTTSQIFNMKINIEKTEIMAIAKKERNITISIDNKHLKQVKEFNYLGSIISSDGKKQ